MSTWLFICYGYKWIHLRLTFAAHANRCWLEFRGYNHLYSTTYIFQASDGFPSLNYWIILLMNFSQGILLYQLFRCSSQAFLHLTSFLLVANMEWWSRFSVAIIPYFGYSCSRKHGFICEDLETKWKKVISIVATLKMDPFSLSNCQTVQQLFRDDTNNCQPVRALFTDSL